MKRRLLMYVAYFFFNDTATTEIYTLSLHDALPSSTPPTGPPTRSCASSTRTPATGAPSHAPATCSRSEEHTSELQSRPHLVCRLLLEKKNTPTSDDDPVERLYNNL